MEWLQIKKYLDAFCVYFWEGTPVLFTIFTFALFVVTGHTLDAATVLSELWNAFKKPCCREPRFAIYILLHKNFDQTCPWAFAENSLLWSVFCNISLKDFDLDLDEFAHKQVFTSLALFDILTGPFNNFPWVINNIIEVTPSSSLLIWALFGLARKSAVDGEWFST